MSAEALFIEGGARVIDPSDGSTAGFIWVERAPDPHGLLGGQLQRWVLTKLLVHTDGALSGFRFDHWAAAPATLEEWLAAVQVPIAANAEWGADPLSDGLWPAQNGAFYVVAQSTVAPLIASGEGIALSFPDPVHPRQDVVGSLLASSPGGRGLASRSARRSAAGPARTVARPAARPLGSRGQSPPPGPQNNLSIGTRPLPQTVIPLIEMRQWAKGAPEVVGIGGGACQSFEGRTFFEGEELFLLHPGYRRAGAPERTTLWSEVSDANIVGIADLRSRIVSTVTEGCRCEVTGCNYYQDTDPEGLNPPPPEFL